MIDDQQAILQQVHDLLLDYGSAQLRSDYLAELKVEHLSRLSLAGKALPLQLWPVNPELKTRFESKLPLTAWEIPDLFAGEAEFSVSFISFSPIISQVPQSTLDALFEFKPEEKAQGLGIDYQKLRDEIRVNTVAVIGDSIESPIALIMKQETFSIEGFIDVFECSFILPGINLITEEQLQQLSPTSHDLNSQDSNDDPFDRSRKVQALICKVMDQAGIAKAETGVFESNFQPEIVKRIAEHVDLSGIPRFSIDFA